MAEIEAWRTGLAGISPLLGLWQAASADTAAARAPGLALAASGAGAVLLALWIDRRWGEPPTWLHPVVAMGQVLGWMAKYIAPSQDSYCIWWRFICGMLAWIGPGALVFVIAAGVQHSLGAWPWWGQMLALGVLLKPLLAWRMLRSEVLAVDAALQQSLQAGRARLAWLVSRDTRALDAATVRESAIETLAENLSDSVVAPLLWFALLGLPGAALYRWANTADAMWGYPGWRGEGAQRRHWQWAGKWAARADDVLNWLPARLTAALLVAVAAASPTAQRVRCAALRRDAAVTPSPNGGWPMGAMAQALGVQLSKPGVYTLHPTGARPQAPHLWQAVRLAGQVVALVGGGAAALLLGLWIVMGVAHAV